MPDEFYETHLPSPELTPFVRRYLYVEAPADMMVRLAPTGFVYLGHMFNGGEIEVISDGVEKRCPSRWHFMGQIRDKQNVVRFNGHVGHLLAQFTPTGFYRLFRIPASHITNLFPEVHEVDCGLHRALGQALAGCATREARLQALDSWLVRLIPEALPDNPPYVSAAALFIERSDGNARVSELSAQLGICARHLNRVFGHIVGVPPKYFAQVRQIHRILDLLYEGNSTALSALAHTCGYYDQAHLIKAMRRFCGEAPGRVLDCNDLMLNAFLAKPMRVE